MEDQTKNKAEELPEVSSTPQLDPEKIISQLEIKPGSVIADLGCGAGHFVIPFAKKTGEKGTVFAVDILEKPLEAVLSLAHLNYLSNIKIKRTDLEAEGSVKAVLEGVLVDLILISNVLFANENKEKIIGQAIENLAQNGRLVLIDWKKSLFPIGPSEELMVTIPTIKKICEGEGLEFMEELDAGEYHWGLVFKK